MLLTNKQNNSNTNLNNTNNRQDVRETNNSVQVVNEIPTIK